MGPYPSKVELVLDIGGNAPTSCRRGADALVAFMSFTVARGFGSQHPLIALADLAHDTHRVPLGPLTTFYERATEDAEDEEKLDLAWQPAGPLLESLDALHALLRTDPTAGALAARANACTLAEEIAWLVDALRPLEDDTPVRLSYVL